MIMTRTCCSRVHRPPRITRSIINPDEAQKRSLATSRKKTPSKHRPDYLSRYAHPGPVRREESFRRHLIRYRCHLTNQSIRFLPPPIRCHHRTRCDHCHLTNNSLPVSAFYLVSIAAPYRKACRCLLAAVTRSRPPYPDFCSPLAVPSINASKSSRPPLGRHNMPCAQPSAYTLQKAVHNYSFTDPT